MDIETAKSKVDQLIQKSHQDKPCFENIKRSEVKSYKDLNDRFKFQQRNYNFQYSHIYYSRTQQLSKILSEKLKKLHLAPVQVLEIKNDEEVVTVGTLYKEMKLKPSILKKLNQDSNLGPQKFADYTSEDDILFLEDSTGRVKLNFSEYQFDEEDIQTKKSLMSIIEKKYSPQELITGLVVAIKGKTDQVGILNVHQIIFPDPPSNPNENVFKRVRDGVYKFVNKKKFKNIHDLSYYLEGKNDPKDKFVAFISGLNLKYDKSQESLKKFKEFMFGNMPDIRFRKFASKICKVVFAGNMIQDERDHQISLQGAFKVQELYAKMFDEMKKTLILVDDLCHELAKNVTIDIMPGESDPSDDTIPQQPINKAYFPKSYQSEHLKAVPNPYHFEVEDLNVLGSSGSNVLDLMQYSNFSDKGIDILEAMLHWRHIAPSAPDTLKSQNFSDTDPFVLEELPHIFFTGNQKAFDTRLYFNEDQKKVSRLVCVPEFSEKHSFVVVNLNNLDTFEIQC